MMVYMVGYESEAAKRQYEFMSNSEQEAELFAEFLPAKELDEGGVDPVVIREVRINPKRRR